MNPPSGSLQASTAASVLFQLCATNNESTNEPGTLLRDLAIVGRFSLDCQRRQEQLRLFSYCDSGVAE
jgi:hypothetical protein